MDIFRARYIRRIVLCFGTQLGKSETLLNLIGYCVDEDPGSMLMVYPTGELAKSISKNRIEPMIYDCDAVRKKWLPLLSEKMEIQFLGMYLALVGANSPSNLSSRPIRYLFGDEVDKYPPRAGKDSSPIELATERTKTYSNRREVWASSPTYSTGAVWKAYLDCHVQKRYFVPCPHCGSMQTLEFKNVKWPEEFNTDISKEERYVLVLAHAHYECAICHEPIYDMDKIAMLGKGEWRAVKRIADGKGKEGWIEDKEPQSRPESVGYNLSSLYSPWVTFGQIAQKFLGSHSEPITYMNFVNGWLAEPWEPAATRMNSDAVMELELPYERMTVPVDAQIITCGVDVQLDHFWYEVRAWGPRITSWLVDYGRVETWADVELVLEHPWQHESGKDMLINLMFLDSGYRTDEVYEFCAAHPGISFPTKGSSASVIKSPIVESSVEKDGWGGLKLFIIGTKYYKDTIAGRIKPATPDNPARWFVYKGISREYADQICSERLIRETDKNGNIKETWQQIGHAPNHMLDCSVLAMAAAERIGVRYLRQEGGNDS